MFVITGFAVPNLEAHTAAPAPGTSDGSNSETKIYQYLLLIAMAFNTSSI